MKEPNDSSGLYQRILNELYYSDTEDRIKSGKSFFTLRMPFYLEENPKEILDKIK